MSQRLDFVRKYELGQTINEAVEWAGISGPTGYKWWNLYHDNVMDRVKGSIPSL